MENNQGTPFIPFVAARSGTGKTTLLEKVIAELTTRGYRVITVKHVHQAHLDLPGKDSWRHREAGAQGVCLVTPTEFLLIKSVEEIEAPSSLLAWLPPVDFILAEGFRGLKIPKIEVVRAEAGCAVITPPEDLMAVATDLPGLELSVPCFPLNDPIPLVEWMIDRYYPKNSPSEMTHFDQAGRARMVDVSAKESTIRIAVARGEIRMNPQTLKLIKEGRMKKGDVLAVAQIAAIMGVKETPRLIPMCHPLNISGVTVDFDLNDIENKVEIEVEVKLTGQTGVEMEALTGVNLAALTIYDMCKAVDKQMVISNIRLVEKSGGRSGYFRREE